MEQNRAYGTAFKQSQRSGHLHNVALDAFKAQLPTTSAEEVGAYLQS